MYKNIEFLKEVVDDIRYLQREWGQEITNHALRRGSTDLRRLLVQDWLQRAWKAANFDKQPKIMSFSLTETFAEIPKEKFIFAMAGGAMYKGYSIANVFFPNQAEWNESELSNFDSIGLPQRELPLLEFIKAPCILVEGKLVSRRMLINYVANTLGAAHYDSEHRKVPKKYKQIYSMLDHATEKFMYEDKSLIYFELMSIGQAVAKSEDIAMFCERVENFVGDS
ncbi:MAG: hypothetical protein H6652_18525 [Ardenticatenaceae bacterium]|nr:hypothetical protein [Ardenticatenaceae bacterium]